MAQKRESGFYWVLYRDWWVIGEFRDDLDWEVIGLIEGPHGEDVFEKVGERIDLPDEVKQWQKRQ